MTHDNDRLLEQVCAELRQRRYSFHTEQAYVQWTRRFLVFQKERLAAGMPDTEVVAFLTHLATQAHVAARTQNQALSALMFLYTHVLKRDLGKLEGIVTAKRAERKPTCLTTAEANCAKSFVTREGI